MNRVANAGEALKLRKLIDEQLGRVSRLRLDRDAFAAELVDRLERWKGLNQQAESLESTYPRTVALSQKMEAVINQVAHELQRRGARIDPRSGRALSGNRIDAALLGAVWRAADCLAEWQHLYQLIPPDGRPQSRAGTFAARLQQLCRAAGLSDKNVKDLLSDLSGTNGLPKLSPGTVKKREHRGGKKRTSVRNLAWNRLFDALRTRDTEMHKAREAENRHRWGKKQKLLPALPHFGDQLTPAVLLSMRTGVRRAELLALCWRNTDFDRRVLTIEDGIKNRQLPMTDGAMEVLQQWKKQAPNDEVIFPPDAKLDTKWNHVLESADATSLQWEDLENYWYLTSSEL